MPSPQSAGSNGITSYATCPVPIAKEAVSDTSRITSSTEDKVKLKDKGKGQMKGKADAPRVTFFVGDGGRGVFLDAGVMERRRRLFGVDLSGG